MPLDPQVQVVLDKIRDAGNPEYWQMTVADARAWHVRKAAILDIGPVPVAKIQDQTIDGPHGRIPLRIYWPRSSEVPLPVLVWLHGGGHVVGTLDSYDALCRMFCMNTDCIVVAVDYRLAPEHRFPAGVDDSFAALKWTFENAASFGGDPQRIALGGDSAGGNLAAVCAILARDAKIGDLVLQLLVYPRTAAEESAESHHKFAEGYLLTRRTILWFHQHYRARDDDRRDWRYAPLDCPDLSDLPPALVIVGEYDPLHDEGVAYAKALERAGNAVTLSDYPGMIHPFFSMGGAIDAGRAAHREATQALRRAFGMERVGMTPTAALAAARLLSSSWRNGEHIDALPESCRPVSRADGYAIQEQWSDEVSDEIAGWKIAATSLAGQKHIAVSGPIAGPIFAHRVRGDGAQVSLKGNRMRVAECEIVFVLRERLGSRGRPYGRRDVLAAVGSARPGIEVPDSRFLQFERAGEAQLIADCACMNEMVLGEGIAADNRLESLAQLDVRATMGNGMIHSGIGANALGDPVEALVWLVNELTQQGRAIEAGQFVTTGTCLTPIPVSPGDTIAADYGWLGRLGVRFS